ncbi:hypothetical protein ACQCN2_07205 [Brevibacillus ginsengisoli]|uniref:hypothetical protein n=1 Tax=Brevibacillus ginsengisoli TaxID=363854 RepID=UPI003CFA3E9D
MSTTELLLGASFEGRVLRTLQSFFRRSNDVLLRESLWATGLEMDQVDVVMSMLDDNHTVSEIMESLRQKGVFNK